MTTYYVDASSSLASDKNTGLSAATPFASLAAVNKLNLQPGDTVALKAGATYTSTAAGSGALVIKAVGTLEKPITFTSYGSGDAPIIKNLGSGYSDGIQLIGAKYVTIDGLNITSGSQAGINVDKNSSFIKIQNVEASGVGEGVILNGTNSLVTHSYFHDLKMIKNTANGGDDDYGAVGVMIGGSNNEISFNKIVNASAPSYDYGRDGGGFEIFGNVSNVSIHDNWVENSNGFMEAGGPKMSISNITLANNVSLNNGNFVVLHNGQNAATFSNLDASRNTIVNEKSQPKEMAVVYLDAAYKTGQISFHDNSVYLNNGDSVFKQTGSYHSNNTFYLASSATHLYNNWSMTLNAGEAFGKIAGPASGAALVAAVQTQSGHGAAATVSSQAGLAAPPVPAAAPTVAPVAAPVAQAVVAPPAPAPAPAPVPLVTDTHGITGQSYVSEHKVLNASGNVVLLERFHADGTKDYSQSLGASGAVTSQNYDASGKLIQQSVANPDGSRVVDAYNVTGQSYTTQHSTYDSRGVLTSLSRYHADGTKDYTTVLTLDGATTAQTYDAAGTLTVKTVTAANGASVMTSFAKSGAVTGTIEKNAAGVQTHTVTYRADGTKDYATDLNADGSTTGLKYDAAGSLTAKTVTAASGASVMTSFAQSGAVTGTIEKNAAGVQTHTVTYRADGAKDYATDLNADGSTTGLKYDASGTLTVETVTAANGASVMTFLAKSGTVTGMVEKNAAGVQIHTVNYHADGTRDYATDLNADGSTTALKYDAVGTLAVKTVTAMNGSSLMTWFGADGSTIQSKMANPDGSSLVKSFDASGQLTQKVDVHVDGSREVDTFLIKGLSYTSQHVSYDSHNATTSLVRYHADSTKDYARTVSADGSTTTSQYDATGHLKAETIAQKDGSYVATTLDASGLLTQSTAGHSDGSSDVYRFRAEDGKSINSAHLSYDSGKKLEYSETFNPDGTHTAYVTASGVTLAGTAAKDTFFSYGSDTFAFGAGSGKDAVYNFHAGSAADHDTIAISKAVVQDFAHLALRQAGSDVVVDLSAHDSITLKGVSLAALSHHDFLFV